MTHVKTVKTLGELRAYASGWNALVETSSQNSVFLTWEWVSNWFEVYLGGRDLLTLAVLEDELPVAVAPFWVERRRYFRMVPIRVLRIAGSPEADYTDLIVPSRDVDRYSRLIWDELFGPLANEWDVLELVDVPERSPVLRCFDAYARSDPRCLAVETIGRSVCPYLELPESWDAFLNTFSRSGRYTINYSRRRLAEQGALEFEMCRGAGDLDGMMSDFIRLHEKAWKERGMPGALATDEARTFHNRVAPAMLERDALFLARLRLDGRAIGVFYGYEYNSKVYYYLMGVEKNPAKRVKNGTALLGFCIEEAIHRGCREFDFLRGDEEYKSRWTSNQRRNAWRRYYNRSASARMFRLLRRARGAARRGTGQDNS